MDLVDVRYLVASTRYEVTKVIRSILRYHFEDAFQSRVKIHAMIQRLDHIAVKVRATIQTLLKIGSQSPHRQPGGKYPHSYSVGQNEKATSFDRIWRASADETDPEATGFASWSAMLLHLMIHKAFCVLYHPLIKDSAIELAVPIRTEYEIESDVSSR